MTSMNPLTGEQDKIGDLSEINALVLAGSKVRRPSGRTKARSWIVVWGIGLVFLAVGTFPVAGDTYLEAITRASQFTNLPWDTHLLTSADAITMTTNSTTCLGVVSLMSDYVWTSFYQPHVGGLMTNTVGHESWVTFQPELKQYLNARTSEFSAGLSGATMRGEMVLGMTNSASHIWAVELWVPVDALFRPAINWSITETWTDTSWSGHDTNGPSWFLTNYGESYYQWFTNRQATIYQGNNAFPWSGLGYSYDWYYPTNSSSIVGLSEFVVGGGQGFYVAGASHVDQYLIPEPGTTWLVLAGSGAAFFIRRRNRVPHPTR